MEPPTVEQQKKNLSRVSYVVNTIQIVVIGGFIIACLMNANNAKSSELNVNVGDISAGYKQFLQSGYHEGGASPATYTLEVLGKDDMLFSQSDEYTDRKDKTWLSFTTDVKLSSRTVTGTGIEARVSTPWRAYHNKELIGTYSTDVAVVESRFPPVYFPFDECYAVSDMLVTTANIIALYGGIALGILVFIWSVSFVSWLMCSQVMTDTEKRRDMKLETLFMRFRFLIPLIALVIFLYIQWKTIHATSDTINVCYTQFSPLQTLLDTLHTGGMVIGVGILVLEALWRIAVVWYVQGDMLNDYDYASLRV